MIDNQPPKAVPQPNQQKKIFLLLTGGGILLALALIVVGIIIFFVWRNQSVADAGTPTPVLTATTTMPAADTPTVSIDVEVMASPTPAAAADSPATQTDETVMRQPTATRIPTTTPTPVSLPRQSTVARVDGTIELRTPANDTQVSGDIVEFQWIWHKNKGCLPPPDGFAFEIRIWQDMDSAAPMGAMDAGAEKQNIQCDPDTGIRSFTLGKMRSVPGAGGQADGRLRWDVALVQVLPYKPVITTQHRTFFY
jgi:hypothetical protein